MEGFAVVFQSLDVGLSLQDLGDESLLEDVLVVEHLVSLKVHVGGLVQDGTVHHEIDIINSVANLRNDITLDEALKIEFLQVL
jgi:hypothetical protein